MSAHTYTIKEAAKLSGLPESTLRYYETIGIIGPIDRDASSKHRVYSDENIDLIVGVACLHATGLSLDDMRSYLKNAARGSQATKGNIELLRTQKQRLAEEAHYLELRRRYVEVKIAYWHAVADGDEAKAKAIADKARALAKELTLSRED